jgi:L-rhamnose mutarotase
MRCCFLLQVRPERLDEYKKEHQAVWPEMLIALRDSGWRNYSIFAGKDGLLVGYLEADDFDAAQRAMAQTDANARWQAHMASYFVDIDGQQPSRPLTLLEEVFNLEDQLGRLSS